MMLVVSSSTREGSATHHENLVLIADLGAEEGSSGLGIVAGIAELALAREVTAAVRCSDFRPVFAAACREVILGLLALLRAVGQSALGAHVGLAHHDVETFLAAAGLESCDTGHEKCEDGDNLHCTMGISGKAKSSGA